MKQPSEFKLLKEIEYFDFEEDFVEKNFRCIPMVVRFKMDLAGIKLKLSEWARFRTGERIALAQMPAGSIEEVVAYSLFLSSLIKKHTGNQATQLPIDPNPDWARPDCIPDMVRQKAEEINLRIAPRSWQSMTNLQRFALLKLCRPGHENKNFPKAAREFGLVKN